MDDLTLADLSLEDRRALKHDHPLLDAFAAQMEKEYELPAGMLRAIKNAGEKSESLGGPGKSISPKGAQGVMQFMPGTATLVDLKDPTDPLEAIRKAGVYVSTIAKELGTQDPVLIAAAYNAGPNRASLRRGDVPAIPETQKYVERVSKYMAGMAAPTSEPAQTIGWADLSPEDRRAVRKANPGVNPMEGVGTGQAALEGAGKFFSDTGRGAAQLAGDWLINPLSRLATGRNLVDTEGMRAEEVEARQRDEALMGTAGGLGGYMGAGALTMALPGSMIAKSAPVMAATNAARAIPGIGGAAAIAVPAAVTGGALSAASPVAEEGERAENMAFGAAVGPVAALGAAGLGKLGSAVAQLPGVKSAAEMIKSINIPGLWKPSWNNTLNATERSAVQTAAREGVPVYSSQLRNPGSSLSAGQASAQRSGFDRAVARQIGENTDDLVTAFSNANRRLSDNYDKLITGKTIPLGRDHLRDLAAISRYNSSRSPRFPPNKELDEFVLRAAEAAKQSKTMSGEDWQQALRGYKAELTKMAQGTATNPSDPHAAKGFGMLIDTLTKQAEKVMSKEELALFRQTNQQWRKMSMLETLAPKDANGNINPKTLANVLARKDKQAFIYGKGDGTLPGLARYGGTYMGLDATAPRSIVQRGKDLARQTAPMLAGDAVGAYALGHAMGGDREEKSFSEDLLKYAALGTGVHLGLTGLRNATNPRLGLNDLSAQRGALGELASRMRLGDAAALSGNAARER